MGVPIWKAGTSFHESPICVAATIYTRSFVYSGERHLEHRRDLSM